MQAYTTISSNRSQHQHWQCMSSSFQS
jgi:hypothetical protein